MLIRVMSHYDGFYSDEMVEDDLVFQEFNRAPIAKPECFKETETSEEKNDEWLKKSSSD